MVLLLKKLLHFIILMKDNVPLWVAMNAVTFGQLSAFYQYMPNEVQVKVSKYFPGYTEKQLHQFITIIAK